MSEVPKFERDPSELVESRVVLQFRRHGKKEKAQEGQVDADIPLTAEGRKQAESLGQQFQPQVETSVAFGSLRKRAKEVAGRAMLANEEGVNTDMSLEQIEALVAEELKYGKKIAADPRLDFDEGHGKVLGDLTEKAYGEKRTSEFMILESDKIAQETKDETTSSYTRLAGQVASLVKKYVEVGENFNKLASVNQDKYKEFANQMERYLGTHNTVGESFLARVIEKQEGVEARNEFMKKLGPLGFPEAQGFRIDIINHGQRQELVVSVDLQGETVSFQVKPETLDELIEDRTRFNEQIAESNKTP